MPIAVELNKKKQQQHRAGQARERNEKEMSGLEEKRNEVAGCGGLVM